MPETVPPNPPSPFADADPAYRHLFAEMLFFGPPSPGVLAFAGCGRMAVVPDEPLAVADLDDMPEGVCPTCLATARDGIEPTDDRTPAPCRLCESRGPDGLCALCRMELHERWTAAGRPDGVTLDHAVTATIQADDRAEVLLNEVLNTPEEPRA